MSIITDLLKGFRKRAVWPVPLKVSCQLVDDWYVFTCKELPGFHVADKDYSTAFDEVSPALEQYYAERDRVISHAAAADGTGSKRRPN